MPSHIVVNKLGLTYKSTVGVSTATLPDVCKTPSPAGPVPIPYPNFANQSSLKNGTKTVKAKGKMIAVKGSEYSMSFGDEPGTAGGVKSSTFKKETSWITYSFDVKMDGKNACRHTDKKFHNHKNTVDLAGNIDPAIVIEGLEKLVCKCNKDIKPKRGEKCHELGVRQHECCDLALKNGAVPGAKGEQGYRRRDGGRSWPRKQRSNENYGQWRRRISKQLFPDAAVVDADGNVQQFIDFKFQCPKPPRKGEPRPQVWTPGKKGKPGQFEKYKALGRQLRPRVKKDPMIISNEKC